MNKDKKNTTSNVLPPLDPYDDSNVSDETELHQNMIPDQVPRKDGPGGEASE